MSVDTESDATAAEENETERTSADNKTAPALRSLGVIEGSSWIWTRSRRPAPLCSSTVAEGGRLQVATLREGPLKEIGRFLSKRPELFKSAFKVGEAFKEN